VIDEYKIGKYVNLEDAPAIAQTIKEMANNSTLLDELSSNCIQASVSTFNWESQEKILIDLYMDLLS
jgi:glycosyltransferase involved in cell wall biosynthesis